MSPIPESGRVRWMSLVLLGWMLGAWPAVVVGQAGDPLLPLTAPPGASLPSPGASQQLLERLGKMEGRLDWLTKQNEGLVRENKVLAEKVEASCRPTSNPGPQGVMTSVLSGSAPTGVDAPWDGGTRAFSLADPEAGSGGVDGQVASASDGSERVTAAAAGGGSRASGGGDPTAIGRAQEVGNLHLAKVPLNPYYDFDDGGFHVATQDGEFSFGMRGMTQLDGMLYERPTPGVDTSSGFYNPRSRIYFEGLATKLISWEYSFQNYYDTVAILDAYVNFNFDPGFQLRIGRYKNPFGYEFYRIHIWDLLAPERSIWANNFEANRRLGLMAHGVLLEQRVEYALGSFDTQRNGFGTLNNRQDFQGFLNFKPFYPMEESFLLRNLQFGGSVDLGNENQPTMPPALRTNQSPGGDGADSTAVSNAATVPFLAFNPNVRESGGLALWELHLAHYLGGLSLISALEGGHDSYSNGTGAPPVHVPVHGWFVQGGYLLTGETIRDRTLIQPLHPFDLREGRFGLGAWEVTARFSQLDLGSQVFTAGLADPKLWTNQARMTDVGANWYLNQFVKVYFDWEHGMFGSPVLATDNHFRNSYDLFWVRTQVYF